MCEYSRTAWNFLPHGGTVEVYYRPLSILRRALWGNGNSVHEPTNLSNWGIEKTP